MTDTARLNRSLDRARSDAEADLAPLVRIYEAALEKLAVRASRSFSAMTAAGVPPWQPPPDGNLMQGLDEIALGVTTAQARIHRRILRTVAGGPLARLGIAWDVKHPLSLALLAKAARRTGERLGLAVQPVLREAIASAYEDGLSVTDTSALIRSRLTEAAPWQADMLARTDLNGLANGGSAIAAKLAGAGFKVWLAILDDRTRPEHAAANGQVVPVDHAFSVGGEDLEYPGDPAGSDAMCANCRCTLVYQDSLTASGGGSIMAQMVTDDFDRARGSQSALAAALPSGVDALPSGVRSCSMRGTPGYSGGGACHIHDGSDAGMRSALRKAQADARKRNGASVVAAGSPASVAFKGMAAIEGLVTDDNTPMPRILLAKSLTWPELPVPFMAQTQTADGHDGAEIAGRIDSFKRVRGESGQWDIEFAGELTTPFGINEIAPMIADETLRGVSVDLGATNYVVVDRATLAEVPDGELEVDAMASGQYLLGLKTGKIRALTLVPVQALEGANASLVASVGATAVFTGAAEFVLAASRAIVAAGAPAKPPREWLETAEPPGKMPLTITEDGRVFGHLATWDSCHVAFLPSCVPPPKSPSGYAYFHAGELETAEGDRVAVGKLMVGGRHDNNLGHSREEAMRHYDDNTKVGAYVRATDGRYGIWVCGAVRPGLSEGLLQELRANPPSGDWRVVDGRHELIAGLAVPVPGFPNPRAQMQLVASGGEVAMGSLVFSSGEFEASPAAARSLVAAGVLPDDGEERARLRALVARAEGGIDGLVALAER